MYKYMNAPPSPEVQICSKTMYSTINEDSLDFLNHVAYTSSFGPSMPNPFSIGITGKGQ
jgi:hypothetical protein